MQKFDDDLKALAAEYKTKHTAALAKHKPPIYMKLLQATSFLPTSANCTQRLYHVERDLFSIPLCKNCQINCVKWHNTSKTKQYVEFCSINCASSAKSTIQSRKDTLTEKYGVDSFSKTNEFKEIIKNCWTDELKEQADQNRRKTMMDRYGVEYASQNDLIREKQKQTTLERYGASNILQSEYVKQIIKDKHGVDHYTQSDSFVEKRRETMLDRYGVEFCGQNPDLLKQRYNTCLSRYGTPFPKNKHISHDAMLLLNDCAWLLNEHTIKQRSLSDIAHGLGVDLGTVRYRFIQADLMIKRHPTSQPERDITSLINSLGMETINNDRTILGGRELDIVIPAAKVAIEYCGLYWHCSAHSSRRPSDHQAKLKACNVAGYRLITIFEDEWVHNRTLVESKIKQILGVSTRERVHARKTSLVSLSSTDKKQFFDDNHIQGNGPGSVTYGLVHNNVIVAAMTFIKRSQGVYELNRFATSCNVVGGFSKLLSHFQSHHLWTEIISFADLRWSEGGVYKSCGFVLDKTLPHDYEYVDIKNIKRIHKFNFRHKNLPHILGDLYDGNLSESENTKRAGWYKIYNCGLQRWTIKRAE